MGVDDSVSCVPQRQRRNARQVKTETIISPRPFARSYIHRRLVRAPEA